MAMEYDYFKVALALEKAGANTTLKSTAGHQAKDGIEGGKVRACVALLSVDTPAELIEALGWLEADADERAKIDKGEFAGIRMKVCSIAGRGRLPSKLLLTTLELGLEAINFLSLSSSWLLNSSAQESLRWLGQRCRCKVQGSNDDDLMTRRMWGNANYFVTSTHVELRTALETRNHTPPRSRLRYHTTREDDSK